MAQEHDLPAWLEPYRRSLTTILSSQRALRLKLYAADGGGHLQGLDWLPGDMTGPQMGAWLAAKFREHGPLRLRAYEEDKKQEGAIIQRANILLLNGPPEPVEGEGEAGGVVERLLILFTSEGSEDRLRILGRGLGAIQSGIREASERELRGLARSEARALIQEMAQEEGLQEVRDGD